MVHEYIEDPVILTDALNAGHSEVATLLDVCSRLVGEARRRIGGAAG